MTVRVALLLLAASAAISGAAEPSLRTVLSRVERYVERYEPALSTLVAREHYVQIVPPSGTRSGQRRTLVSDFLFFRLPGNNAPWLGFRDVLEVDGQPLENQGDWLREIVASPESAERRALAMARENARYNIGRFMRTVNVPICVVAWMHPRIRDRFSFKQAGEEPIDGTRTWRIEYTEKRKPTLVRTPDGSYVMSSGRIWVDPENGRVLQTELRNTLGDLAVTIQVRFVANDTFGVLVPSRMREAYDDGVDRLETEAVYSDYRRFTTGARIR